MKEYDAEYFSWQKNIGAFGGKANLFKFENWVGEHDDVLDFGCGGGYLLHNLGTDGKKTGVDINFSAAMNAVNKFDIYVHPFTYGIDSNSHDVVISNHALEHVEDPLEVLKEFRRIVRPNGAVVVVVPHESSKKWSKKDMNGHLYTWSPQTLVNLFEAAGIEVVTCKSICHMWPPHYRAIQRIFGWKLFHKICWLYCLIKGTGYQTRVVGIVDKEVEEE